MPRTTSPFICPALIIGAFGVAALLGTVTGVLFANSSDLPIIAELDEYSPATITRLYARGGELIGEFATERRTVPKYDDIPEVLRNAIIAAEGGDIFDHVGISVPRVLATVLTPLYVKTVVHAAKSAAWRAR